MASTNAARKLAATHPRAVGKPAKERVLIEFPSAALRRADEAARARGVSRSEFIRTAVEQSLEAMETAEFERELAEACIANSERNLELLKEFEHVDLEAFYREAFK
jgi:metal-responsive CopG/Arc/MetJ family transcriptional regulator